MSIEQTPFSAYGSGWKNQLIRVYFYLSQGLDVVNQFKYLVAGVLAFYYMLGRDDLRLLITMFVVSIPVLIVVGYIWAKRVRKSMDWFAIEHTTHFAKYGYELQEKTIALLEEIRDSKKV